MQSLRDTPFGEGCNVTRWIIPCLGGFVCPFGAPLRGEPHRDRSNPPPGIAGISGTPTGHSIGENNIAALGPRTSLASPGQTWPSQPAPGRPPSPGGPSKLLAPPGRSGPQRGPRTKGQVSGPTSLRSGSFFTVVLYFSRVVLYISQVVFTFFISTILLTNPYVHDILYILLVHFGWGSEGLLGQVQGVPLGEWGCRNGYIPTPPTPLR